MNMIEKVAIAIGGLWPDYCNPCTKEKILKCKDCLDAAKAAIEAIKEPTEEMLNTGILFRPNVVYSDEVKEMYQKIIDAALKND